jgi:hypothetical protein
MNMFLRTQYIETPRSNCYEHVCNCQHIQGSKSNCHQNAWNCQHIDQGELRNQDSLELEELELESEAASSLPGPGEPAGAGGGSTSIASWITGSAARPLPRLPARPGTGPRPRPRRAALAAALTVAGAAGAAAAAAPRKMPGTSHGRSVYLVCDSQAILKHSIADPLQPWAFHDLDALPNIHWMRHLPLNSSLKMWLFGGTQ